MAKSFVAAIHNVRSLHNVGSIFRTSEGANVDKLFLTGYTGRPPRTEIAKVALGSEERIPWEGVKRVGAILDKLKKEGYQIVALEQDSRAVPLWDFKPESKIALIAGNEVLGVSKALRDKADVIVEIPMLGTRKSLNVSVAYGIAAFEISRRL
jgi:tRNA G18 (ribose-2'-O)-methylase SpoU